MQSRTIKNLADNNNVGLIVSIFANRTKKWYIVL